MEIEDNKEKHMILNALEFFVDFKFTTNSAMSTRYCNMMKEIDQNDYAVLCKQMGGKPKWEPNL